MSPSHFTDYPYDFAAIATYRYESLPAEMQTAYDLSYDMATYASTLPDPMPAELAKFA